MMVQKVGLIGLGKMGSEIAKQLLKNGVDLLLWGRSQTTLTDWRERGATVVQSPLALANACDIVVLCVTDTDAVESVLFEDNGIASANKAILVVDHSTIHPIATQQFAEKLALSNGSRWLDIPVSGGPIGVRNRTLIGMAGGDVNDLNQAMPLLKLYSAKITLVGNVGAGQASKVVNQMLIGGNVAVLAEALNYADNFGISASDLPDALAGGWADSSVLQVHGRRMTAADYSAEVDAAIMLKDIDIALDMGARTNSRMPVTALVRRSYKKLIESGHRNKGQSGLMWLYKQQALK